MDVLCISGSPRAGGNTDALLSAMCSATDGQLIRLVEYRIKPCAACWKCRAERRCAIADDMTETLTPLLLQSDAVILGSPVFFNNVTAQMKAFMDRTWCLRGSLRNKIGGAVVVGRRYGAESAITAIHGFFLKHEMIVAHRGVSGEAFERGEIAGDAEAADAMRKLASRVRELVSKTTLLRGPQDTLKEKTQ